MLASDVNNPQFVGAQDPDSIMVARFYVKAVRNNFKSNAEGRHVFEDKTYCEYYPAGQRLLVMDIPVREEHKMRFPKQWAYFQSTKKSDGAGSGTPLDHWPLLSPADVENLRALKFSTVDQIAACSDSGLQALGMGMAGMSAHVFRATAQAYLGAAKDTALPQQQAADIEALKKQIADLTAMLKPAPAAPAVVAEAAPAPAPEPSGRPKRVWTDEQKAAAGERMAKARAAKRKQPEAT